MSKNLKDEDNKKIWLSVNFLTIIVFILFYYVIGPALSSDKQLVVSLFYTLGALGVLGAVISCMKLKGLMKLFSVIGLLGSLAFIAYAYFISTFLIAF